MNYTYVYSRKVRNLAHSSNRMLKLQMTDKRSSCSWIVRTIVATLSVLLFPTSASSEEQFDAVRGYILNAVDTRKSGVVSVAIAVADGGEIVWEEGFGWADEQHRNPATANTMYSLASISKPITATAIMTLVEDGKIDLEKSVNLYLKDSKLTGQPELANAATVCRIANHTSGLPRHVNFYYADEELAKPAMQQTIHRYGKLIAIPGEQHIYSNLGYGILGHVISQVSGMDYSDYLSKEIFKPLGMTNSSVGEPASPKALTAARYDIDGDRLPFYDFDHTGASAVYASAHDLVTFGIMHLGSGGFRNASVLSPPSIERMRHPECSNDGHDAYGLGWRLDQSAGLEVVSHSGGMPGVSTLLVLLPSKGIAVVVLTNRYGSPGAANELVRWPIANRILQKLLPGWSLDYEAKRPSAEKVIGFPESLVGRWRGTVDTYASPLSIELQFFESGMLTAKLADGLPRLVENARLTNSRVEGDFQGHLNTAELNDRKPYSLRLSLHLDDRNTLQGSTYARSSGRGRFRFLLPHYTAVKRTAMQH